MKNIQSFLLARKTCIDGAIHYNIILYYTFTRNIYSIIFLNSLIVGAKICTAMILCPIIIIYYYRCVYIFFYLFQNIFHSNLSNWHWFSKFARFSPYHNMNYVCSMYPANLHTWLNHFSSYRCFFCIYWWRKVRKLYFYLLYRLYSCFIFFIYSAISLSYNIYLKILRAIQIVYVLHYTLVPLCITIGLIVAYQ